MRKGTTASRGDADRTVDSMVDITTVDTTVAYTARGNVTVAVEASTRVPVVVVMVVTGSVAEGSMENRMPTMQRTFLKICTVKTHMTLVAMMEGKCLMNVLLMMFSEQTLMVLMMMNGQ